MRYFVKVAEIGNITRASERLNVAQTALGQQIRHLEESLGVRLFVRHSRGISLTEAGELLYRHAKNILGAIEEARREVTALSDSKKEAIRLGITPSIQALIGTKLLKVAAAKLPRVSLGIIEELSFVLIDALLRGEIDLALAYELDRRRDLMVTPLIEEELLFVASSERQARRASITFAEVAATNLALVSERDIIWRRMHEEARRLRITMNVAFEVQSMPAIKALVARGAATTVVPFGLMADEIQQGLVTACPICEPAIKRTLYLTRPLDHKPLINEHSLIVFLDTIVTQLAESMGPHGTLIGKVTDTPL
ncbi:LysR family transcriptional regulator [Ensifer sp. B1-9]|uniref:LysR family transcriptional regulator n=1 Tax=Ensifer sp. B1-9 TaxID=3141455 RepID=UPI003D219D2F